MLKLENINFRYEKDYVLKDFNLKLSNGLNFIIGNNNSGKSTLCKIIGGKLPYMGNIYLNDKDFKRNKNCIFICDSYVDSIKENVKKYLFNIDDKIIDYFELGDYIDSNISELNYSVKVKICIAKFFVDDVDVLLIDNMFCWLSKNDRNKIFKKLKSVSKKKIIIITTNNMEDLIISDRIILLNKGEVIIDKNRDEFFMEKNKLEKYNVSLPFLVDLSYNLKLYNIVDNIYFDTRKLVDAIWK